MTGYILIVDDDKDIRELLGMALKKLQSQVGEATDVAALKKAFSGVQPDLVLLDMNLNGESGMKMLPLIKKEWPETEIIVITGKPTYEIAVEATQAGAFNFVTKPFDLPNLMVTIDRALEHKQQMEALNVARQKGGTNVFESAAMKNVMKMVQKIAPQGVEVLITGESGSGKEVIARLIHELNPAAKGPLVSVNCAALPRELIESELFGSVKGAFTGANADREGLFRTAENGTLFLDEISEMPIDTQAKLLRVLQEKEVRPVGGKSTYKSNCRIVSATNRKPEEAIKDGKLREDLFYRIGAITVHLPPLRERRDDIMPLAISFLKRFAAQANRVIHGFKPAAVERINSFDWPGNVRQLQNEIQRAVLLSEGDEVDASDLSITNTHTTTPGAADETADANFTLLEGVERNAIAQMLKETNGNKLETAKRLGIGRQTLYNKIKAYGIEA